MIIKGFRLLKESKELKESALDYIDPVGKITDRAAQLAQNIEDKTGISRRNYYQRDDDNSTGDSDDKTTGYTKGKDKNNKEEQPVEIPVSQIPIYFELITVMNVNNLTVNDKKKLYSYSFNGITLIIFDNKKFLKIEFSRNYNSLKDFTKYDIKTITNNKFLNTKNNLNIYKYFMLTKPTELLKKQ